jgi:hypothetical protein
MFKKIVYGAFAPEVHALTMQKSFCLIVSDLYGLFFSSLSRSVLRNVGYAVLSKHGIFGR